MATFAIAGTTVIDLKVSPSIILSFGFPPQTPESFFRTNLTSNMAALLNVPPHKIRRINIVSAQNTQ
jgi:hypothetical protein